MRIGWDASGGPLPAPIRDEPVLVDGAVQASLLAPLEARPERLIFCNPAHPGACLRLTLRGSDGVSRAHAGLLVAGRLGYSNMVALEGEARAVLNETGHAGAVGFQRGRPGELPGAV